MASTLSAIREKVSSGRRLSAADGELLLSEETDLHFVGELADQVRHRLHGAVTYYNLNAHLNPTNVCIYRCPLCAYSRDADEPDAYTMTPEAALAQADAAATAGCTELHIVGGVNPQIGFDWYLRLLARIHERHPRLHLKAFTAVEIAWFAQVSGVSVRRVLEELIAVGVGSLPGGGAEIFAPEVRARLSPRKADARAWLAVHREAHRLGLKSNATMLFGHIEHDEHRIDHLIQLRTLQDETGGFQAFIPLAFHADHTQLPHVRGPSSLLSLRMVAVSRLMLDNFPHIKAYWVSLGLGVAQTALCYGANDLDGTVRGEKIHHEAGATSPTALSIDELRRMITEVGGEPVERDSLYRVK